MKKITLITLIILILGLLFYNLYQTLDIQKKTSVEILKVFTNQLSVKDLKGKYENIFISINKDTIIINSNGEEKSIDDLKEGTSINVYHSGIYDKDYVAKISRCSKIEILEN